MTRLPVPNSDGGTLNAKMEGQEDAETFVKTSVQETNILHVNFDLVGGIGFIPNSKQPSVTHKEPSRQAASEHTIVLYSRCDNDNIGLSDTKRNNGTSIKNMEEHALPEKQVVAHPMKSGNHLSIINLQSIVHVQSLSNYLFIYRNFIGIQLQ